MCGATSSAKLPAVDPESGTIYLTEDESNGRLCRFIVNNYVKGEIPHLNDGLPQVAEVPSSGVVELKDVGMRVLNLLNSFEPEVWPTTTQNNIDGCLTPMAAKRHKICTGKSTWQQEQTLLHIPLLRPYS